MKDGPSDEEEGDAMKDGPSGEEEEEAMAAMKNEEEEETMKVEEGSQTAVKEEEDEPEDDSIGRKTNYDRTSTASDITYEADNQGRNMRPR